MKKHRFRLLVTLVLTGGAFCLQAAERVLVVNAADIQAHALEKVRAHAEAQLRVPVAATNVSAIEGADLKSIGKSAAKMKTPGDACLIILAVPGKTSALHAVMLTNELVTVVNAQAMKASDEVTYVCRLQRQVMRGAGFMFGLAPDPDPRCVMHDYRTVEELDKMGMNFSPPWGMMFQKAATERGLQVRQLQRPRPKKAAASPPPPPAPGSATKEPPALK